MLLQKTSVSLCARSLPARRPSRCSAARRLVPCTRLHRCRAAANDASAGNGAGVLGVSSLPLPQAPSEPPLAEQMAAAQYAVLSQFSQVHWTEVLAGVLYLLFMSEVRARRRGERGEFSVAATATLRLPFASAADAALLRRGHYRLAAQQAAGWLAGGAAV